MASKTLEEILEDAKKASGESSTNLPVLRDEGDYVVFRVVEALREERYKSPGQYQTNVIIQVAEGKAGGESIEAGKYKLYCGSAVLTRIADTYGFKHGDQVALVLKREVQTGKGNPMKDFSYEGYDARGRNIKDNLALQMERRGEQQNIEPVAEDKPTLPQPDDARVKDGIPF